MDKKYYMNFEDSQDYIQKRGLDIPWNDCDIFIDERAITRTVGNVLLWADENPIHYDGKAMLHVLQKGVKQGKKQALEEFEKNRLEHCDNITKEQYDLESNFVTRHLEKHHRIPTILDAIEYGLEKGKEEMLEKATKWLNENKDNSFIKCEDPCLIGYLTDEFIEDFRKAMEE